jgi:class 3 adenylate cyclase
VGDDTRLEFTILGMRLNVAARIKDATKQFGRPLLASEAVVAAAGELIQWRVISVDSLRGRTDVLKILGPKPRPVRGFGRKQQSLLDQDQEPPTAMTMPTPAVTR